MNKAQEICGFLDDDGRFYKDEIPNTFLEV